MDTPYTILAQMRAKLGKRDELGAILRAQVAPTRAEPGCLAYHLHASDVDAALFVIYENWRRVEDLEAHLREPHMEEFRTRGEDLIEGGLVVVTLTMLSNYTQAPGG